MGATMLLSGACARACRPGSRGAKCHRRRSAARRTRAGGTKGGDAEKVEDKAGRDKSAAQEGLPPSRSSGAGTDAHAHGFGARPAASDEDEWGSGAKDDHWQLPKLGAVLLIVAAVAAYFLSRFSAGYKQAHLAPVHGSNQVAAARPAERPAEEVAERQNQDAQADEPRRRVQWGRRDAKDAELEPAQGPEASTSDRFDADSRKGLRPDVAGRQLTAPLDAERADGSVDDVAASDDAMGAVSGATGAAASKASTRDGAAAEAPSDAKKGPGSELFLQNLFSGLDGRAAGAPSGGDKAPQTRAPGGSEGGQSPSKAAGKAEPGKAEQGQAGGTSAPVRGKTSGAEVGASEARGVAAGDDGGAASASKAVSKDADADEEPQPEKRGVPWVDVKQPDLAVDQAEARQVEAMPAEVRLRERAVLATRAARAASQAAQTASTYSAASCHAASLAASAASEATQAAAQAREAAEVAAEADFERALQRTQAARAKAQAAEDDAAANAAGASALGDIAREQEDVAKLLAEQPSEASKAPSLAQHGSGAWQSAKQALEHASDTVREWWAQIAAWLGQVWGAFVAWTCSVGTWAKDAFRRGK